MERLIIARESVWGDESDTASVQLTVLTLLAALSH